MEYENAWNMHKNEGMVGLVMANRMDDYSNLTIIVPTLNEEKNIKTLLGKLKGYSNAAVIVVDDGSSDDTLQIAKKSGAGVIDRKNREIKGITASVLEGIGKTKTKYFIVMDSDLQHPPEKVGELFSLLREGNDLVVAWRISVPGWGLHRRAISVGAEILGKARLILGKNPIPRDILSGFFGGETELVKKSITQNPRRFVGGGYKVLFDLIKGMEAGKTRIGEIGYTFGMRAGGSSKIGPRHVVFYLYSVFR